MSAHYIVVDARGLGKAVFSTEAEAYGERDWADRVEACSCASPASHIDARAIA